MDKVLKLLMEDARLTNEQIATMLNISVDEVSAAIKGYSDKKIIKGYKAIVDTDEISDSPVTALIELKVTPLRDLGFDGVAKEIMKFDEVESVYLMSGGYDLAVTVMGNDFRDIALFVARRLSTLDGVISTATHFILKKYKYLGLDFVKEEVDERGQTLL